MPTIVPSRLAIDQRIFVCLGASFLGRMSAMLAILVVQIFILFHRVSTLPLFWGDQGCTKLKKSVYQAVIQSVIRCKSVELRPGELTQVKFIFKNCPKVIIIQTLGIDGDKKWSPFQDSGFPSPIFCTKKRTFEYRSQASIRQFLKIAFFRLIFGRFSLRKIYPDKRSVHSLTC